jgi:hypothetical protein
MLPVQGMQVGLYQIDFQVIFRREFDMKPQPGGGFDVRGLLNVDSSRG